MTQGVGRTATTAVSAMSLIAMGDIDPDPKLVMGIPARANPHRHRQPRRAGVEVRHLEQVFGSPGTSEPISFPFIDSTRRVHVAADRGLPRRRDRG